MMMFQTVQGQIKVTVPGQGHAHCRQ